MVLTKRIIYNVKTGELKEETFDFTPPPPPPKMYRVYRKKIVTPKRTIYTHEIILKDLTSEEITTLEAEGFTVEEI
jgi:hypothetical protein